MNPPASLVPVSVHTQEIGESQDLLTLLPDSSATAWVRGGDGLVGWGEFDRIEVTGADRFEKIRFWWRERCARFTIHDEVKKFGSGPVLFLSGTFDGDEPSVAIIPKIVVGQRNGRTWVTWIGDENAPNSICNQTRGSVKSQLGWRNYLSRAMGD